MKRTTIQQLKALAIAHGIQPTGDRRRKATWEAALKGNPSVYHTLVASVKTNSKRKSTTPTTATILTHSNKQEVFEFPEARVDQVVALIRKWNKKAAKHPHIAPIVYQELERKPVTYYQWDGTTITYEAVWIEVTYPELIQKGDYKLVGMVEVLKGGNLVHCFDSAIATRLQEADYSSKHLTCNHCHTKRYRRKYHIFLNQVDDSLELVGNTCAKEYFGFAPGLALEGLTFLRNYRDSLSEEDKLSKPLYSVERIVELAVAAIAHQPWVGAHAAEPKGEPTYHLVLDNVRASTGLPEERRLLPSAADSKRSERILSDWSSLVAEGSLLDDEWAIKKAVMMRSQYVEAKHVALLTGMVYSDILVEDRAIARKAAAPTAGHFGTVKKRETFYLKVTKVVPFAGYKNSVSHMVVGVERSTGCQFKWIDTCSKDWYQAGSVYKVKATVKAHDVHPTYGTQTTLRRVSLAVR